VISVSGAPVTPEPAASNGFKIERNYFTLDGKPADPSKAKQNDRFAVVLKVTEAKPEYGHIMVSDYLPAGFEIDNPHLVSSGDTGTLDWIEDGEEPENNRIPRRPLHRRDRPRQRRQGGVSRWLTSSARYRPANTCCRRPMSRHVQSLALWPHRHWQCRGAFREMSAPSHQTQSSCAGLTRASIDLRKILSKKMDGRVKPGHDGGGVGKRRVLIVLAALCVSVAVATGIWIVSLGPLPLAQAQQVSTSVVDRNGKLLRAYAMADGRWRLPVDARTGRRSWISKTAAGL